MSDPFLSRDWADNHARFTSGLGDALDHAWRTLRASLAVLHAKQFDAPWLHDRNAR